VGKLRNFENRYKFHSAPPYRNRTVEHLYHHRMYRVNARKDNDGVWREFITGLEVHFHHYPGFRQEAGRPGDTLIWDSRKNHLLIADIHKKYGALCYRRKPKGILIDKVLPPPRHRR
jgi:hypothetical protein